MRTSRWIILEVVAIFAIGAISPYIPKTLVGVLFWLVTALVLGGIIFNTVRGFLRMIGVLETPPVEYSARYEEGEENVGMFKRSPSDGHYYAHHHTLSVIHDSDITKMC